MSDRSGMARVCRGIPNRSPDDPAIIYSDPREGGDGSYHLDGRKDYTQWRWRVGQLNQGGVSSALVAGAGGVVGPLTDVLIDFGAQEGDQGDSEIAYFWGRESGSNLRFAVQPQLGPPLNKYLANVPISSNLVFGTSQLPGYLPSPIYAYANADLKFNAHALGSFAETIQVGAFCRARNDCKAQVEGRRIAMEYYSTIWIGPQDKLNTAYTGPEISIAAGATAKLRFPAPDKYDAQVAWILDDSTSTTGSEPVMDVIIQDEKNREQLIDLPTGLSWRDFLACPTVTVTGMPAGGVVRAMSLKSPRGGWSHRIPANSALEVEIFSRDSGTITFRAAMLGWAVTCR